MQEEARKVILRLFCKQNNLDEKNLEENLKLVASETYAPFLVFTECLDTKLFKDRNNPFDGFFLNMIHRASITFGGMVSLVSTGHLQEAEALTRTLTESSLSIQFLLHGDAEKNISHYLASYYVGQKWKNDKWNAVFNEAAAHPHHQLIEEKNESENEAKNVCKFFIEAAGGEWPLKPQSASIDRMFKVLDKEVEYRTVYRAMCGQTHHNQEDLVNNLLYSLTENQNLEVETKNKKHTFSIYICLWGMRYFLEALQALSKRYNFGSVQEQSQIALDVVDIQHKKIALSLQPPQFPSGWSSSIIEGI